MAMEAEQFEVKRPARGEIPTQLTMQPLYQCFSMEQEKDQPVKDDTEQLKLEISQLKNELKAKSTQLEQLNKVKETS